MLALLLAHNAYVFGSPLSLAYDYTPFQGMRAGFFGLHGPDVGAGFEILLGGRGLLWIAPILVLTLPAIYFLAARPNERNVAWLVVWIALYFIAMNSSYYLPGGGWSSGPRHLTPMLAFLCLPLAILWDRLPTHRAVRKLRRR